MMSWSSFMFLALLGSIVTSSGLPSSRNDAELECPDVYDMSCKTDTECECGSKERLICNFNHVCHEISIRDIVERQRCPKMFKKRCVANEDCNCPGMVCADHECVYDKNKLN